MEIVVSTEKLRKEFKKLVAVDDVNIQLESGDIFGLVGQNGSGKTTLIRMLATVLKPTSGNVFIFGQDVSRNPQRIRSLIGYLPYSYSPYYDLTVREYMGFFAGAYKIPKSERQQIIDDILDLTDLASNAKCYIRDLPDGMTQKLGIARVLIHDPDFLLLDEPLCGLDPKARIEVMEIIKELGNMKKTVILSSGIISDVLFMCNKIGVMKNGKLAVSGDAGDVDISDYL